MLLRSRSKLLRYCSSLTPAGKPPSPLSAESPAYLETKHIKHLLNKPTTATQKRVRFNMKCEWMVCMMIALPFYLL
jgi:hypothetical protein